MFVLTCVLFAGAKEGLEVDGGFSSSSDNDDDDAHVHGDAHGDAHGEDDDEDTESDDDFFKTDKKRRHPPATQPPKGGFGRPCGWFMTPPAIVEAEFTRRYRSRA